MGSWNGQWAWTGDCVTDGHRLGWAGPLDEFGPSPEIGRAPDLIGVVVVSAGNDIEGFGWQSGLEDLPAQFEWNDVVVVPVNDQLRERQARKAIDQGEVRPKQPMNRQPPVMELGHCFDRWKRRFEDQPSGRFLQDKSPSNGRPERAPEYNDAFGTNHSCSREIVVRPERILIEPLLRRPPLTPAIAAVVE